MDLYLSIIIPVFNEEENIVPLISEIESALSNQTWDYEIIAVDDGSHDRSFEVLKTLAHDNRRLRVLRFWKNSGQSAAFDAGFRKVRGLNVITMDSDRQNNPNDIPKLLTKLEEGYDFVTGWRKDRKDDFFFRTLPSRIANKLIRKVTDTHFQDLGCSLKAYRRAITDRLFLYGEMHRFISVSVEMLGARVAEVEVDHRPRVAGVSKYNLTRTVKVLFDLMTVWFFQRFHTKPIYIFGSVSAVLTVGSVFLSALVLWQKYEEGVFVHRNPLFIISVFSFAIAVQFLFMGIVAEILIRTYFESQGQRPYAIRESIGG